MKASRLAAALATLLLAGAARAQSLIPGNYVDDFGPVTSSRATSAAPQAPAHASPIASNYVDDFGSTAPARAAAREEVGAAGAEPGRMGADAARRAQDQAAVDAYNHEQFLRSVWAALP